MVADWGGYGVIGVGNSGHVSLENCSFTGNEIYNNNYGAAVVQANALADADGSTEVRLQGCSFSDNSPSTLPVLLADNRAGDRSKGLSFSDDALLVCSYEGPMKGQPLPPRVYSAPAALGSSGDGGLFLDTSGLEMLTQLPRHYMTRRSLLLPAVT